MIFPVKTLAAIFVALQASTVVADVSISKPTTGSTFTVDGDSVSVEVVWIESNATPTLDNIKSYTFTICTGPNSDINGLQAVKSAVSSDDITNDSITLSIPADVGADGSYYIQVYAVTDDGGYTIHYTQRFTLEGMTGDTEPSGEDETSPPDAQTSLDSGATTTVAAADLSKSFSLYYTSQTGKTRYAPMQTQPGSTVTATTWTRHYPTSAVTYYTSLSTSLAQVSTVTAGWDYTISSGVNWASPAPHPSENGGWYSAGSRIISASLTGLTTQSGSSDSDSDSDASTSSSSSSSASSLTSSSSSS